MRTKEKISRPEFGPDSSGPFLCAQVDLTNIPVCTSQFGSARSSGYNFKTKL